MGYRVYFGSLPKTEEPVIITEEGYQDTNPLTKQLIELGKYVSWRPKGAVNLIHDDMECYVADKEFLLEIIENYRQLNYEYFNDFHTRFEEMTKRIVNDGEKLTDADLTLLSEANSYYYRKGQSGWGEWTTNLLAVNLDESQPHEVCRSWLYEYSIFNLVHVLKTFDWENDNLLFYGY